MNITYTQVGDYLFPNLIPPESPNVGRWGNAAAQLSSELSGRNLYQNAHLEKVDRQANEMEQRLISQLAQQENITEEFKAENQLE